MSDRQSPIDFDQVIVEIENANTFSQARKISQTFFSKLFLSLPESIQSNFSDSLYKWSTNKLHTRETKIRLAALCGFSFYVDIEDDQNNLVSITQTMERILPVEDVTIIDGVARLVHKIARKTTSPFVPHLIERILSWLTVARDPRTTPASIISSLFLFMRLSELDSDFYSKYQQQIDTIRMTALTYDSPEIHQAVITLTYNIISKNPEATERVSELIQRILECLRTDTIIIKIKPAEPDKTNGFPIDNFIKADFHTHSQGFFALFRSFFKDYTDLCEIKAKEIFEAVCTFLQKYPNEDYLSFLADLIDALPDEATKFLDQIYSLLSNSSIINFHNVTSCQIFSRILKQLPTYLSVYANDISFGILNHSPDSYFIIMKAIIECAPKIVDRKFLLRAFDVSKFTLYMVDCAIEFAKAYKSQTFTFIHIFTKKLDVFNNVSLTFLSRISFLEQFPLTNYWDPVYDLYNRLIIPEPKYEIPQRQQQQETMNSYLLSDQLSLVKVSDKPEEIKLTLVNDNKSDEAKQTLVIDNSDVFSNELEDKIELKVLSIKTLNSIIKRYKDPEQSSKIFGLLNRIQSENRKIQSAFLESIDDSLIHHFTQPSFFFIVCQLFNNDSLNAKMSALSLITRIRNVSPISTLNFFFNDLSSYPSTIRQIPSKRDQYKMIELFPSLIIASDRFVAPHGEQLLSFFLGILNARIPSQTTPNEAIKELENSRYDRLIRVCAMRCISSVAQFYMCNTETMTKLVDSIVDQLLNINHKKVQIAAIQTLRILFREYSLVKTMDSKEIVKLNQNLFNFIKNSSTSTMQWKCPQVYTELLRLFGTIGSLDPNEFHMPHTHTQTEDSYPLYDRSKREQSYLNFVMNYILGQLKDTSKAHDLFVLINAVVYIFQSDAMKCLDYLEEVISVFTSIHDRPNAQIQPHELFPSIKAIVLVVDIEILPHADVIYKLILPYLTDKQDLEAIKLLNALIYSVKKNFMPYGSSTFALITSLLDDEKNVSGSEKEITLMLSLTLLVIYVGGSPQIYFNRISKRALAKNQASEPALTFLSQALRSAPLKELAIPSLRLAIQLHNFESCQTAAQYLMVILVIRFPNIINNLPLDPSWKNYINSIYNSEPIRSDPFKFLHKFEPKPDQHQILSMPVMTLLPLNQIFNRGKFSSEPDVNDSAAWLLHFMQDLVLCSNSPAIRASHPLLSLSPEFEAELFPFVIVSVWDNALEKDRTYLTNLLFKIAHKDKISPDILSAIAAACDAMDRANFSLFQNPTISGEIAEKCNSYFRALRFFEKALSKSTEPTTHLLNINMTLKRKESATGLLSIAVSADSNCALLEALSMWAQARDVYEKKYNEDPKNEQMLEGYLNCCMYLEDWDRIEKRVNEFSHLLDSKDLPIEVKPKVAVTFAACMRNTHGDPSKYLEAIKSDDPYSCTWRAIVALDQNKLELADKWVTRGLNLLSNDMTSFSSGSYEPALLSICYAMMFEELKDIIDQRRNLNTANGILKIWNSKADYVKRDAAHLRNVYRVRELLQCSNEQLFTIHLDFVDSLRKLKEYTLFDNSFKRLFANLQSDPRVQLMQAKYSYDRGMINTLNQFIYIISQLEGKPDKEDVYCDAILSYVSRSTISQAVLDRLRDVIELQPTRVRAWKHWAYYNLGCAQPSSSAPYLAKTSDKPNETDNAVKFAADAIKGFTKLIELTGPSFHFLCQLCALFFTFGTRLENFKEIAENLVNLKPASVIQIIPQLMVQFDHPDPEVRNILYRIIRVFANDHFQALTMPFCLLKATPSSSEALLEFIDQLSREHPKLMEDAETFTKGMVQIAVSGVEEVIILLERANYLAENSGRYEEIYKILKQAVDIISRKPQKSFIHTIFQDSKVNQFCKMVSTMPIKPKEICSAANIALNLKSTLQARMETIPAIDIAEMGYILASTSSFSLAVPGFYSVGKEPIVTIQSIGHVLKLIPSAKRPRKLRIIGSDGITYKYLLKGREDLRLDQRVMQLFGLTNSILHDDKFGVERRLHIRQVAIIPIATNAGLIAWAKGGETLYSLISFHRRIIGVDCSEEQKYIKKYLGDEATLGEREFALRMNRIQKLELHRELCGLAFDDDLREALWLHSPNAEMWLNQITNFARSNGLMSIIGYLIGIGDRHPSNILVMKGTGNVVHIDFSDIFEKANLRKWVRETVPFRLTRMLVRALGASGTHGVYEMTSDYVMTLMRRNKETLLAFLEIFIQDPITDTLWYKNEDSSPPDMNTKANDSNNDTPNDFSELRRAIKKVSDKLNGIEFGVQMTVKDQVKKLIENATSEMNLAQMYYGWAPFW